MYLVNLTHGGLSYLIAVRISFLPPGSKGPIHVLPHHCGLRSWGDAACLLSEGTNLHQPYLWGGSQDDFSKSPTRGPSLCELSKMRTCVSTSVT